MDVQLRILEGDAVPALESLADWLSGEPDLSGRIRLAASGPRRGELGALTDAVVVSVGSGGVLSVLATSLKAWLMHPRRSDIRVVVQEKGNRKVEVDARRVTSEDVEKLLRSVLSPPGTE